MSRILVASLLSVALTGCATWDGMTAEQKRYWSAVSFVTTGFFIPIEEED